MVDNSPLDNSEGSPEGESLEDISPSLKGTSNKPKPRQSKPKEKAKDIAKKPADKAVKKGVRQLALNAARAIGSAIASAFASVAGAVGWPWLAGCVVIFLIILLIFGGLGTLAVNRYFAGSLPQPAGKNDTNVQALIAASSKVALDNEAGKHYKLEFLNTRDKEYLESGQIDKRLAAALNYLVQKHDLIRVSHIVSGYEDMSINPESGSFHDIQISNNISAHKRGEAADIDEIDGVKQQCKCGPSIPVQIAWQAIGDTPYGATTPDVLQNVKSASDLANEAIKKALEELGIKGLDQADIQTKLQSITGITSIFDLTKPSVIAALNAIGVTGFDDPTLQTGLKRLEALKGLYDLNPQDLNTLTSGQGADLLGQIGVQITPEIRQSIEKYQQAQVLEGIKSIDDLAKPEVQKALNSFGIDPNDPTFKSYFEKTLAVRTVLNWQGSYTDPTFQKAITTLNLPGGSDLVEALKLYQAYSGGLNTQAGTVISDPNIVEPINKSGVSIDTPDTQNIFSTIRAASQINDWQSAFGSALKNTALIYFGLEMNEHNKDLYNKFDAAQYLAHYNGSLDDPQYQAALSTLNVTSDQVVTFRELGSIPSLIKYTNLQTLFPTEFQKFKDIQSLLKIKSISDLNGSDIQKVLDDFNINLPNNYQDILGYVDIANIIKNTTMADILSSSGQAMLSYLKISPDTAKYFGYFSDLSAISQIHNPMDLTRPDVQAALKNYGIDTGTAGEMLGKVGDINALLSVNNPEDLLKPGTIKALGDLGVINVNSELLGQISSIQTLLQIRTVGDIFNPSTVLALNNLGIIGLSNPVTAALTAILMIDQFFGLNLFSCSGNTNCYKSTAQANVHKVIGELLQMPYDLGNPDYYSVTQLITYSEERDVLPFAAKLDQLYGTDRPSNLGLFAMPEASGNIHIGY